jgi:hypothetical protein
MTPDLMITSCSVPVGRMPPLSAMTKTPVGCPSTADAVDDEEPRSRGVQPTASAEVSYPVVVIVRR